MGSARVDGLMDDQMRPARTTVGGEFTSISRANQGSQCPTRKQ